MVAVKISEFKAKLSAYLKKVKAGAEISLLDRGTEVARIVPTSHESQVDIIPPSKDPEELGKLKSKVSGFKGEVMDTLYEERDRR